ncbi:MAG TPA: S8 family peptidase [Candidatus Limnocylindria bacterium]|nr:S8 family peptidase [Candidatus Limnocylindria bacterium]
MIRSAMRLLAATMTVALLLGTTATPTAASSFDETKLDASFLSEVLAAPTADFDVIVRSVPVESEGRADRAAARRIEKAAKSVTTQGGSVKHALSIVGAVSARLKGVQILKLTRDGDVDYVVKDQRLRALFDPAQGSAAARTPGILEVNAPQVWSQLGVTGQGVGVAIVDSGVYPHPDLAGRIVASIDFTAASPTVSSTSTGDPGGHGTHVAGLVAGDGTASGGAYTGVAPRANIVNVRVIDASGGSNVSTIMRGLQWVLANRSTYNIKVVNLSLGATPMGSYKSDLMATAAEVLNFAGVTVVVSAGNTGPLAGTVTTPGTDPYVITVGALDDSGTSLLLDDLMAVFSSRGRTVFDNLSKPDVVAPGRRMVSLRSPGSVLDTLFPDRQVTATGALTPDYYRLSGTSMAAPVVAGVIALMVERNPSLSPAQIKKRLKTTATALTFGTAFDRGAGLVNAYKAASSVDVSREFAPDRVSDAFAKDMKKFIQGQPFVWRDLTYHGGVDSAGTSWEGVTWENVRWDSVTWENVTWEGFTWEGISWEGVTWETVTWQSTDQQSTSAQSGTGASWDPVD